MWTLPIGCALLDNQLTWTRPSGGFSCEAKGKPVDLLVNVNLKVPGVLGVHVLWAEVS